MLVKVIILAAGEGKRFKSALPKVLAQVGGRPMVAWVVDAVQQSGLTDRPVVVVGVGAEQVKATLGERCEYVSQQQQLGTGHAVAACRTFLEGHVDTIVVLYGDAPLVSAQTIRGLVAEHQLVQPAVTLTTAVVPDFSGWREAFREFGRIERDRTGKVLRVIEARDATPAQLALREVNPGYYCCMATWLWPHLEKLSNRNAQGEYYLVDLVGLAIAEGAPVATIAIPPEEALGVNSPVELEILEQFMKHKT